MGEVDGGPTWSILNKHGMLACSGMCSEVGRAEKSKPGKEAGSTEVKALGELLGWAKDWKGLLPQVAQCYMNITGSLRMKLSNGEPARLSRSPDSNDSERGAKDRDEKCGCQNLLPLL